MDAPGPAARAAFSFGEFRVGPFDSTLPCFDEFGAFNPANPLVAGERGDVVPGGQRHRVVSQCFLQIRRYLVYRTAQHFTV